MHEVGKADGNAKKGRFCTLRFKVIGRGFKRCFRGGAVVGAQPDGKRKG